MPAPTTRSFRRVSIKDWPVSSLADDRYQRLLSGPDPLSLLLRLVSEAEVAAQAKRITAKWQEADECPGYWRVVAQIPLPEPTFDEFFNGRSGYRAQYYLSPEEGILYNRATLDLVREPVLQACAQRGLRASPHLLSASLTAPHAKVWVFDDQEAFDGALPQTLNPERWVANGGDRGRRAPLPSHLCLDVKGAFLHPRTEELFIDESKLDRAWDLFRKGFA
jgi:hypothetical protein